MNSVFNGVNNRNRGCSVQKYANIVYRNNRSEAECSICCEYYNKTTRVPVSMPCGHTFCKTCVVKMVVHQSSFACFVCRCKISTNPGTWTKNYDLLAMLEKQRLLAIDDDNHENLYRLSTNLPQERHQPPPVVQHHQNIPNIRPLQREPQNIIWKPLEPDNSVYSRQFQQPRFLAVAQQLQDRLAHNSINKENRNHQLISMRGYPLSPRLPRFHLEVDAMIELMCREYGCRNNTEFQYQQVNPNFRPPYCPCKDNKIPKQL